MTDLVGDDRALDAAVPHEWRRRRLHLIGEDRGRVSLHGDAEDAVVAAERAVHEQKMEHRTAVALRPARRAGGAQLIGGPTLGAATDRRASGHRDRLAGDVAEYRREVIDARLLWSGTGLRAHLD